MYRVFPIYTPILIFQYFMYRVFAIHFSIQFFQYILPNTSYKRFSNIFPIHFSIIPVRRFRNRFYSQTFFNTFCQYFKYRVLPIHFSILHVQLFPNTFSNTLFHNTSLNQIRQYVKLNNH